MDKQVLRYDAFGQPVGVLEALKYANSLGNQRTQSIVIKIVLGVIAFLFFMAFMVGLVVASSLYTFILVLLFFVAVPLIFVVLAGYAIYVSAVRSLRLKRFSEANGFSFLVNKPHQPHPGVIFGIGHSQQYMTVVSGNYHGQQFEFGNFYCTVGSGKSSRRRSFGVVEVKLGRKLPHMLLDSRANNHFGFSNLPIFKSSQHLQLEGDFNKHFALYAPDGYERDALYVLTPELMALLIDLGARYDIEIIDDHLYVYSEGEFKLDKQPAIEAIFQLISVLGGEVKENTGRYTDANIGNRQANIVAEPGRRLKRTFSWLAVAFFVVWTVYVILLFF